MTPTDSSTNCPECDWPMVREAVPRTPDDSPGTAADVRGGPTELPSAGALSQLWLCH